MAIRKAFTYNDGATKVDPGKSKVQIFPVTYVRQMLPSPYLPHWNIVRSYLRNPSGLLIQTLPVPQLEHSLYFDHMDTTLQEIEQLAH